MTNDTQKSTGFIDKIVSGFKTLSGNYLIDISLVDNAKPISNTISTKYLVYKPGYEIDFTEDVKQATCFDFILGNFIENNIYIIRRDFNNLSGSPTLWNTSLRVPSRNNQQT